jgi:hypothetical protein
LAKTQQQQQKQHKTSNEFYNEGERCERKGCDDDDGEGRRIGGRRGALASFLARNILCAEKT